MIDFYAPWCSHCKKLEPLLGELQKDLDTLTSTIGSAAVKIGKLDATVNAEIAKDYNVKSYPTIVFINVESNLVVKYEGTNCYLYYQLGISNIFNHYRISDKRGLPSTNQEANNKCNYQH